MNRSILIVICDFLLVSLLAFSSPDMKKLSQPTVTPAPKISMVTPNPVTGQDDLGVAMRVALEEERKNRNTLLAELARAQETVNERGQTITNVRSQLRLTEEEAARLHALETNLTGQVVTAQSNIVALTEALRASTEASKEQTARTEAQRAELEAEVRKQVERAGVLEGQLAGLQESNQLILADRAVLNTRLQVTEAQRQSALEKATQLQTEVQAQHELNVKLADNVKTLATQSTQLAQEIRENRELTPNEIYEQLSTNRVNASFYGLKRGLFGIDSSKFKQTQILLAGEGSNTFAICHVQDTLLSLWNPAQWEDLSGTLVHEAAVFSIDSISFCPTDPRVVLIPVPASQARALGCKVYSLSKDPFKFQEAVVAGTQESYYGECRFQMETDAPGYLKMDRNSLKGLFGKFNPSSGDLVLSKTGDLLGVMVNNNYCVVLRSLAAGAPVRFGWAGDSPKTAQTLTDLYGVVAQMPFKLQ